MQVPEDLGHRIIKAAQWAVALHQEADRQVGEIDKATGRRPAVGSADAGNVTDDAPTTATDWRLPWTRAGENPAGSFAH